MMEGVRERGGEGRGSSDGTERGGEGRGSSDGTDGRHRRKARTGRLGTALLGPSAGTVRLPQGPGAQAMKPVLAFKTTLVTSDVSRVKII